jgi:hypothetical protein
MQKGFLIGDSGGVATQKELVTVRPVNNANTKSEPRNEQLLIENSKIDTTHTRFDLGTGIEREGEVARTHQHA